MIDSIKITITSDVEPAGVHSQLDSWVASYTPSGPLRKAIIKRTLLIAAFDERFVDKTIGDEDLRKLLHQVAREMLTEPPVPLTAADSDGVLSTARESWSQRWPRSRRDEQAR